MSFFLPILAIDFLPLSSFDSFTRGPEKTSGELDLNSPLIFDFISDT